MGYRLYREIRDFAPADWTSGELVVAWVIADDARDETRRSFISQAELCFRARLKAATVREKLAMLAARGYEFRVIHGHGKDGRPVYAAKGHAVDYVVPDLLIGAGLPAPKPVDNLTIGAGLPAPNVPAKALVSASKAPEIPPKGAGLPAPPSLNPLSNPSQPVAEVVTTSGGSVDNPAPSTQPESSPGAASRQPAPLPRCTSCGGILGPDGTCILPGCISRDVVTGNA